MTSASSSLTGVLSLLRLSLRSGWLGILGTTLLVAGLITAVALSIDSLYASLAERQQYEATLGESPASQAFNGRGYGLDTIGGITAYEVGFLGQLLFPLLAVHLAIRHTRREEEAGRTELMTATRVGRLAPLAAASLTVLVTMTAIGVLTFAGTVWVGLPPAGAGWYAAGTAALMLCFASLGLLLGQVAQSARTGYLAGLAAVTAAFLVRALIDGSGWGAVWASPLGWFAEFRPFSEPQVWPLFAFLVSTVALLVGAAVIAVRRDLGAGILAASAGPERGREYLSTAMGLSWRLNRSMVLAWAVTAMLWGGVFGLLTQEMAELVDANPTMLEALGVDDGSDVVTSLAVVVICLAATATAVQGMSRLISEESSGRLGTVLAARISRRRFWLGWWSVVGASAVVVLVLGSVALGLVTWTVMAEPAALATAMKVGFGYAVPVVFVAAVAALLRSMGQRWSVLGWALVGWIATVGFLAETLQLPGWARDISPLHLVGQLPQEDINGWALAVLAAGGGFLLLLSVGLMSRRDLETG